MDEECPENQEKVAPKTDPSGMNGISPSIEKDRSTFRDVLRKRLLEPLAVSDNPPGVDAWGVALGLLIALGLPIGGHTVALCLVRMFFRFNVVVAFAFTWIVNPFTVIPLYYGYYYVGSLILGGESVMGAAGFEKAMEPIIHSQHFLEALRQFALLDLQVLKRWAITAMMVSVPVSVLGYLIAYRIQSSRRASRVQAAEATLT